MKKNFKVVLGALTSVLMTQQVDAQIAKIKDYGFKQMAPIGTFQGIQFREAGLSGLFPIPNTNGKEFWTVSDRGVNIDAANANVAGCRPTYDKIYAFPNYAPKIHRVKLEGDSVRVLQTIAIKRPNGTTATGIINPTGFGSTALEVPSIDTVQSCGVDNANFNAKTVAKDAWGIDSEGIAVDKDGNFWICEEGGPTIWKVGKDGVVIARYTPYANLDGHESQDILIDPVFSYRKNNRGFEGIAIAPNGKVYAIIQSPILFPTKSVGESSRVHRILEIDPTTNATRMLVYLNDGVIGASGADQIRLRDWKIGDMVAVNNTEFLVLEAAARGTSDVKRLYKINIANATAVTGGIDYSSNTKSLEALVGTSSDELAANSIVPVEKTLVMDLLANEWPAVLDKAEGIAIINDSTIAISNDNDYGQYSPLEDGLAVATGKNSHIITYDLGTNKLNLVQGQAPNAKEITGPNSSDMPYVVPSRSDVEMTSIISVGDTANNGYKMVGLSDGSGAFDNNDGTFTFLLNHEIGGTLGVERAHGQKGAFVSKWVMNKSDLSVVSGSDLIQNVKLWNKATQTFDTYNAANKSELSVFNRFCAAELAEPSAFYNTTNGNGSQARILMNGEESGAEGRAFAHIATGVEAGVSYELPALGKLSYENAVASPRMGDKTVVVSMDDATGGQVYVYVGDKQTTGSEVEKAGLTNGKLYGVKVTGYTEELDGTVIPENTAFTLVEIPNVKDTTGAYLQAKSVELGVTAFKRPEDGNWNPMSPNDFYFVTTNSFSGPSRMYRLRFSNSSNPTAGGTITPVLDGTEGPKMMDNLTIDKNGYVYIQEDPGNQAHIAKIWQYNIANDTIVEIAKHDASRVVTGGANFVTQDEESSGIVDVQDILGQGRFLLVDQLHKSIGGELVEPGQILAMKVNNRNEMPLAGPSTNVAPFVQSRVANTTFSSILSVGERANNGYAFTGIPDGTGAYDNGDGTFTFLVNHELQSTASIVRAHGQKGAFISKWKIKKSNLEVLEGADLIQNVKLWNKSTQGYDLFNAANPSLSTAFSRFCAGELAKQTAFYNAATGKGTLDKIMMNGEESGAEGRAFAHISTGSEAGTSYELPLLGKLSYENAVASPKASDKTVVVSTDDATGGQVYVYVGTKQTSGSTVDKAGLTNGKLYGVKINGLTSESDGSVISDNTPFTLVEIPNVKDTTGAYLEAKSVELGVTAFKRPEDGNFDPSAPNDFYFVTTNGFTAPSRMYRLRFQNVENPELGGTVTAVLNGTEGPKMMDNLTVDKYGQVFIQEDPGNQSYNAKIWKYTIASDSLTMIAEHDAERFIAGGSGFLTQDEESSGIVDMSDILGKGKFLLVDQVHNSLGGELVEYGQMLVMTTSDTLSNIAGIIKPTSCGTSLTAMTDYIYGQSVSGATAYRFRVTNTATNAVQVLERSSSYSSPSVFSLAMLPAKSYATTYAVQMAVKKYNTWFAYGTACNVTSPSAPATSVVDAQCDVVLPLINSRINAKAVIGANRYRFEATENGTALTYTSTSASFNLTQLAGGAKYATAYSIKVAYSTDNGVTFSDYGSACTITTPAAPLTKVISSQCGITLASLSNGVYADRKYGATKYKFRIDNNEGSVVEYETVNYFFNFSILTGNKFGKTYTVDVAYSTDGGINYTSYGADCSITTPAAPLTKVKPSQCNSVLPTASTWVLAVPITGANKYKFEVVGNSKTRYFTTAAIGFRLTSLVGGITFGTEYTVRVAYSFDGGLNWSAFGDECKVTTPAPSREVAGPSTPSALSIYPNPFTSTFKIATIFEGLVNVRVMDLTGKLIEQFDVEASELVSKEIGQSYVPGMYQVTISQDEQIENFKIVKND
jgi:Esterase-like activity of phytase/Bacterial protein of unknown function (DUF839)